MFVETTTSSASSFDRRTFSEAAAAFSRTDFKCTESTRNSSSVAHGFIAALLLLEEYEREASLRHKGAAKTPHFDDDEDDVS